MGALAVVVFALVGAVALVIWHGPEASLISDAFRAVSWGWVIVAVFINLISVAVRSSAWRVVIHQAIPPPQPRRRVVFSAFCVGLLGNAALPGRVGELARVAVVSRHVRRRPGTWATIVGTVFAHRLFDVVAAVCLVLYVLYTARIPNWAKPGLSIIIGVGLGLLLAGFLLARRHHRPLNEELGAIRRVLRAARHGLTVLRRGAGRCRALLPAARLDRPALRRLGGVPRFRSTSGFPRRPLILLLMNVVTVFPFWPGNVGLLQAAIAFALLRYGVDYPHGFAYGIGLQAIEASVGVGLGLVFLAREGSRSRCCGGCRR